MKKLTKLLCAALVWVLLLGAAVSCAKQPGQPGTGPSEAGGPPACACGSRRTADRGGQ